MSKPEKQKSKINAVQKRINSFTYAFRGLFYCIRTQSNFKIHIAFVVLVVIAGFYFDVSGEEWLWLIFAMGLVLSAEIVNTAIETLTDLVSPTYHEKAGKTKDLAAGAVLVSAITAALIGLIIFIPKLFS